jgi:4-phytase/acid phosphatase
MRAGTFGRIFALPVAVLAASQSAHAQPEPRWRLDRVVVVMRHGVRPPTKPDALPAVMTSAPWPTWDVGWGELTGHGTQAIGLLGDFDRHRYRRLLGAGCPALRAVADSDQRTVATAQAYLGHLVPGCAVAVDHLRKGERDARFSPFDAASPLTPDAVLAAAQTALPPGGLAALDLGLAPQWHAIDRITGCTMPACSVTARPTALAAPGGRAKLTGSLALGGSFAQTLALEYADGKPLAQVGWGRATRTMITQLSALHAAEFAVTARPAVIAQAGAAALLAEVRNALSADAGPMFSVFVGHDSNLAWLGGALRAHWQVRQFARDDPPPGGALLFERWTNAAGRYRLRVMFRSQTLDEMRHLTPLARAAVIPTGFARCAGARGCDLDGLATALASR